MDEDDSIFSENEEYEFKYSIFLRSLFWITGPMMVALPIYEYYTGKLDYQQHEHLYAAAIFVLGLIAFHAAWRSLGRVVFSKNGITHIHLGRKTFISYLAIREIRNRPGLMSLKIIGMDATIYIEKQIDSYPLAYEILFEKVKDKLQSKNHSQLYFPLTVQTASHQYRFTLGMCAVASAVMAWHLWQVLALSRGEFNLVILGLAGAFFLIGAYMTVELYLKIEISQAGIVIRGLFSKLTIPRSHIAHLDLERNYATEDDPTFDIYIDYLDMPVEEALDEPKVYEKIIPGSLIDTPIEALYELMVQEYGFEDDNNDQD